MQKHMVAARWVLQWRCDEHHGQRLTGVNTLAVQCTVVLVCTQKHTFPEFLCYAWWPIAMLLHTSLLLTCRV